MEKLHLIAKLKWTYLKFITNIRRAQITTTMMKHRLSENLGSLMIDLIVIINIMICIYQKQEHLHK
jgi:hypothetical protein